ncbi:chromosome segregation protein [Legionella sainthelensi]|uniref:AAA family ATPase n=1 Tax=Legionella sainthelensi TaxID=28087 RepID=UPI000F6F63DE|nr:AAA family ATPase [Legionella sainthelensi]VEB39295.1 chromosome segregation protein [Legionella sainthelensi]
MKIKSLQISNILSFKYFEDVTNAEKITFEDGINIIIGENGSGKSTALEVINFLFKRVLYKQYNVNQDLYSRKNQIAINEKKQILMPVNNNSYAEFRLEPNWDTTDKPQFISIEIELDDIDKRNIQNLINNSEKLNKFINSYSTHTLKNTNTNLSTSYKLNIILEHVNKTFGIQLLDCTHDFGFKYLTEYNFYKEAIVIYNFENPKEPIEPLYESFTLISSYRNYHAFEKAISLRDQHPSQQIQSIKNMDFSKSLNTSDKSEPTIFALVRLLVAERHFNLLSQKLDNAECETEANNLPFIIEINKKLKIINLSCKIKLIDLRTWQYSFEFFDLRRNIAITDINSLSAGQKAIIHLVFEAYGRGNIKGGLVIIDEPEIHLHYQFQHEYLQVLSYLNKEQNCQYVLVTHSEALINSSTITHIRRFSLSKEGNTEIKIPNLTTEQKILVQILDNTRSTYAFFAKKVLLVEGDSDRYFFKAIIQHKYPELDQEIAILHMIGKLNYEKWKNLFDGFGLTVFFITDFDYILENSYPSERNISLKKPEDIEKFKANHIDWESKIDSAYKNKIYILKNGDLEKYLKINKKGLDSIIDFCNNKLDAFLNDNNSTHSMEIRKIIEQIIL